MCDVDDDNVHHYIGERLKLEGETREKVGFTEKTAKRHRWGGRREVTVTSKLTHSNIEI